MISNIQTKQVRKYSYLLVVDDQTETHEPNAPNYSSALDRGGLANKFECYVQRQKQIMDRTRPIVHTFTAVFT